MSEDETLIPYLREKRGSEQEPTIIVDSREANGASKVVKGLRERGATVKVEALEKGDYILSDVCAVNAKGFKILCIRLCIVIFLSSFSSLRRFIQKR